MKSTLTYAALSMVLFFALSACSSGTPTSSTDVTSKSLAYPVFTDGNGNGINDYIEARGHEGNGHPYVDNNGDGICDFAQDGSPSWHGPGFMDEDGNGICDYWQAGSVRYNRHDGLRYQDSNRNRVNDYQENFRHLGDGHSFSDADGDGICDYAQDGGSSWHGPGFIDEDGDGFCDRWEKGGHGPHRSRGGR